MKSHRFLAVALAFTVASSGQAQQQHTSSDSKVAEPRASHHVVTMAMIAQNYLSCLRSDNPGVVESALGHVTYLRIAYPNLDLREHEEVIFDLTKTGLNRTIRSKAFVALKVFADPSSFKSAIATRKDTGDGLFEDIAGRMMP
jgi:hypothetical protein